MAPRKKATATKPARVPRFNFYLLLGNGRSESATGTRLVFEPAEPAVVWDGDDIVAEYNRSVVVGWRKQAVVAPLDEDEED